MAVSTGTPTRWHHDVASVCGGMSLMNAVPHPGHGASGRPLQSPFASPPGEGLSSATVNVAWGMFHLPVASGLVVRVGRFDLRRARHMAAPGGGAPAIAPMLARHFGRFHGGL